MTCQDCGGDCSRLPEEAESLELTGRCSACQFEYEIHERIRKVRENDKPISESDQGTGTFAVGAHRA